MEIPAQKMKSIIQYASESFAINKFNKGLSKKKNINKEGCQ